MNKCDVQMRPNNGKKEFYFSGSIDETLILFFDMFSPEQSEITIDLNQIVAINSTGIREWINLMHKLSKSTIKLAHCPKVFIDQVNMVKGFLPENASIESFYVPYYSEQKKSEMKVLFEKNKQFTLTSVNFENNIVDGTGTAFEIDVIPAKYFKFIKA